jgi:hypothetical protein
MSLIEDKYGQKFANKDNFHVKFNSSHKDRRKTKFIFTVMLKEISIYIFFIYSFKINITLKIIIVFVINYY